MLQAKHTVSARVRAVEPRRETVLNPRRETVLNRMDCNGTYWQFILFQKTFIVVENCSGMNSRSPTSLLLGLGVGLIVIAFLFPELPQTSTWVGVASVYLLTVTLLGTLETVTSDGWLSYRQTVVTAVVVLTVPLGLRFWSIYTARPALHLTEFTFVFMEFRFLVPFVASFMTPLGYATTRMHKRSILILIMVLNVLALADSLSYGAGFGPTFAVVYQLAVLVSGVVAGLPLYYYGRSLRNSSFDPGG